MKPTSRTLIERLGFVDPDRSTQLHDKIQLWLYRNLDEVLQSLTSPGRTIKVIHKELEYPITQTTTYSNNIVGFIDLYAAGTLTIDSERSEYFYASFEIKGRIHSCGDLIRQINFYRKHEKSPTVWIVVSPDDRFSKILAEQGIYYYKFKDDSRLF